MISINQVKNTFMTQSFLINSLPKSGTHLLCKAIQLFPGISKKHIHISRFTLDRYQKLEDYQNLKAKSHKWKKIYIGIDSPATVPSYTLIRELKHLKFRRISYSTCHIPFNETVNEVIKKLRFKSLLIIRDPRDVVVSHAKYISTNKEHFLYDFYKKMSISEQIKTSIFGFEGDGDNRLLSIAERFQSVEGWMHQEYNYTTYFEKLVGIQGGGSVQLQQKELKNLANHLGLKYKETDIQRISSALFGGTVTFSKGLIGNWKNVLDLDSKKAFKDSAGQLLVDLGYEKDFDW